jgi:hypothetical protein
MIANPTSPVGEITRKAAEVRYLTLKGSSRQADPLFFVDISLLKLYYTILFLIESVFFGEVS